jgi:hypothetical protein
MRQYFMTQNGGAYRNWELSFQMHGAARRGD